MHFRTLALLGLAFAIGAVPAVADAQSTNVNLGLSTQNFTLFGQGPIQPGSPYGSFRIAQGASTYDTLTNISTFTLSGLIAGGSTGFSSGSYQFVTTYAGVPTPQGGPGAPLGQSNPSNISNFYYDYLDPSTAVTLFLQTTSGNYQESLVKGGQFVSGTGFSFAFGNAVCTGVAVCTQNNVGLTPGATISGPVTLNANFQTLTPAPTPTPGAVPEPASWAMMIVGFGLVGAGLRYRQRRTVLRYA